MKFFVKLVTEKTVEVNMKSSRTMGGVRPYLIQQYQVPSNANFFFGGKN